jgi:CheY-like chemotaxis protein
MTTPYAPAAARGGSTGFPTKKSATQAGDGIMALEQISGCVPDLIVSDVRMPRLDGIGLARVLAPRSPAIPIILMSAAPLPPDCPLPALRKPFTVEDLLTLIARTLPMSVASIALAGLGAV